MGVDRLGRESGGRQIGRESGGRQIGVGEWG